MTYSLKFTMELEKNSDLLIGILSLLQDGKEINSYLATSSYPGKQYSGSWNYRGGLLPPTTEVIEHTGKGLSITTTGRDSSNVRGVDGNFYDISPWEMETDKGVDRGEWGIHRDIGGNPGTLGCVGLKTEKGWAAFERDVKMVRNKGQKRMDLLVIYT